jgi:hypothetical protein
LNSNESPFFNTAKIRLSKESIIDLWPRKKNKNHFRPI